MEAGWEGALSSPGSHLSIFHPIFFSLTALVQRVERTGNSPELLPEKRWRTYGRRDGGPLSASASALARPGLLWERKDLSLCQASGSPRPSRDPFELVAANIALAWREVCFGARPPPSSRRDRFVPLRNFHAAFPARLLIKTRSGSLRNRVVSGASLTISLPRLAARKRGQVLRRVPASRLCLGVWWACAAVWCCRFPLPGVASALCRCGF